MGKILYRLFIHLYSLTIKIASPFNPKAKLWIQGRRKLLKRIEKIIIPGEKIIWMHCSSLGEFEQGRPVLEKFEIRNSKFKLLLTFFSPSGYEVRKNYTGADYIFYLPMDSPRNARAFFDIVKPSLILFIKYEFWHFYLQEAKKRNVPLLLISGIFRKTQPFFKSYGHFHRNMLRCFTHLFVQNTESVSLLNSIGIKDIVSLSGDTRFDRVIEIAENFEPIPFIDNFCAGHEVIVAGSTWSEDDEQLNHYANTKNNIRFIIAPHDISLERLKECKHLYKCSIFYSEISKSIAATTNTIIIDNIGMLSRLYKYATVSYVGGAFGEDGVHNVLEAAVYGVPVVFGPEYRKFYEAIELVKGGGGISIKNLLELENKLDFLLKKDQGYLMACEASRKYVYSKKGSTDQIVEFIQANRLLTN
ncbi:MAG: 3-deoxy-D-manno-octulosonic acid transferase [Segetibacter sp.]|nr:3-deoxy-D-manno-octulosonic acid transferase [Segetibacter sp.]